MKRTGMKKRNMLYPAQAAYTQPAFAQSKFMEKRFRIERYMWDALQKHEFEMWYQPQYDLRTHTCLGAEALVRWRSPQMGFMMPGSFIEIFEHNGFIRELDAYTLESVCAFQRRRLDWGEELLPIFVNQSNRHIKEPGYAEKIAALLQKYRLSGHALGLEFTETAFTQINTKADVDMAAHVVEQLQDMGLLIAIDDFGTGYSSFLLLNILPVDLIKVDRSLLLAAVESYRAQMILSTIFELGGRLKVRVLCEGIENRAEEHMVCALGGDEGQGFLFSRPLPAHAFAHWISCHASPAALGEPHVRRSRYPVQLFRLQL